MNVRYIVLGVSIFFNVFFAWKLLWGDTGVVAYRNLQREYVEQDTRIAALNAANLELSREIKLLQADSKYIEQTIRKRLNYVKDNEILYIFLDDQAAQTLEGVNEPKN